MAHKKGVGSSRNGRNSQSAVPRRQALRRRAGDARATSSSSSAAPSSTPARTSGARNDDTLFALVDGVVKFERKDKDRQKVSVYPVEAPATA